MRAYRCLALAAATIPAAAMAQGDLGMQSSGTISVSISIPPAAAAIAAADGGAVGLWTVTDADSGMMVALPGELGADATAAAVYHPSDLPVSAEFAPNPYLRMAEGSAGTDNGLHRQSFTLARLSDPLPGGVFQPVATMVIASI